MNFSAVYVEGYPSGCKGMDFTAIEVDRIKQAIMTFQFGVFLDLLEVLFVIFEFFAEFFILYGEEVIGQFCCFDGSGDVGYLNLKFIFFRRVI